MKLRDLRSVRRLNNNVAMPVLGLGTWRIPDGRPVRAAVHHALLAGYRHIDTAAVYKNEKGVGEALRDSGLGRDEVFITTKLWNSDQGYDTALAAFDASCARLGVDGVDAYLVHWPEPGKRRESWKALERLYREGRVRAIGVSNYTIRHLEELLETCEIEPAVNQVECSPFLAQPELRAFCRARRIQVVAYSPLTRGAKLGDPVLVEIARTHRRTPAQILIRWALQHDLVVVPKSADPGRIRENAAVFDFRLGPGEMARLDALDEGFRIAWDPSRIP